MRKWMSLGAALGVLAAVLTIVAASASAGSNPNTLTLAVYGDAPYWDTSAAAKSLPKIAEYNATPAFIETVNADPTIQEVVHVGDIHSGSEACTQNYDQKIFDLWK